MPHRSLPHDHGQTIEQELEHMPSAENFQTVAEIFGFPPPQAAQICWFNYQPSGGKRGLLQSR